MFVYQRKVPSWEEEEDNLEPMPTGSVKNCQETQKLNGILLTKKILQLCKRIETRIQCDITDSNIADSCHHRHPDLCPFIEAANIGNIAS